MGLHAAAGTWRKKKMRGEKWTTCLKISESCSPLSCISVQICFLREGNVEWEEWGIALISYSMQTVSNLRWALVRVWHPSQVPQAKQHVQSMQQQPCWHTLSSYSLKRTSQREEKGERGEFFGHTPSRSFTAELLQPIWVLSTRLKREPVSVHAHFESLHSDKTWGDEWQSTASPCRRGRGTSETCPKLSSGMHGLSQWLLPVFLGKTEVGRLL